jgi:hypothetical protein
VIRYWNTLSGNTPDRSFVVYSGDESVQRAFGYLTGYADLDPVFAYLD